MIKQMIALGWQLLAIVAGVLSLLGILSLVFLIWWRKTRCHNKNQDRLECGGFVEDEARPNIFEYGQLCRATNNFSPDQKLGRGEFGVVYKGFLENLNLEIAAKRVSRGSKQWRKGCMPEVKIITRLRHKNLVQLHGWCLHEQGDLILVYDFIPNGDLTDHLFGDRIPPLTWPIRYNIVLGLASAVSHLHDQSVLHRDIKSSNVMLDSNFDAKLGDFGPTRLIDPASISQTTVLAGTLGYLAPECFATGEASKESDVYSFGVVVLEIVCGRKAVLDHDEQGSSTNQVSLVEWVRDLYGEGKLLDAVDSKLGELDEIQAECVLVVGLWCCHPDRHHRPSTTQALSVLKFQAPLPKPTI